MAKKNISPYGVRKFTDIDEYHASFPPIVQNKLNQLRRVISQAAPNAVETISYNIPTFRQHKNLVHYAAYENHIGLYPTSTPIRIFREELSGYKTSKAAIQIPLNKRLPVSLIRKIVRYRVHEDQQKTKPLPEIKTQR